MPTAGRDLRSSPRAIAAARPICSQGAGRQRGATLLPIARRPAPLTDRIALALELADLRAAKVALALKVIDVGGGVTPYEPIARTGHAPAGGSWHMVWAKAGDHASRVKAASGRSVPAIRSPAGRASPLANRASKLRLKLAAAPALSITIKSLSCRLSPDAEKFAAPVRKKRPSI
jgi:hypothetical protein